jgi:hypothetical protein
VGVPGESRLPPYPFIARAYAGCQGWADLRTAKVSHGAAWFVSNTFDMESRLVRNGSVLCDLVPSVLHAGVPTGLEGHWYDCTLVTRSRITPEASDIFEVVSSDGVFHPFEISRTRIGSEGWEVEGRILLKRGPLS